MASKRSRDEIAKEIIENLIQYDQWRDNLVVNDFPITRRNIIAALDKTRAETIEEIALLADKHIEDAPASIGKYAWADIRDAIRALINQDELKGTK